MNNYNVSSTATASTSHHKKAVLFSIALHLVVFLFFMLTPSAARIPGHDVLFVSLHSEAAIPMGSNGPDVRMQESLPVKMVRDNPPVAALPADVASRNQRVVPEEKQQVAMVEKAPSQDSPDEIKDDNSSPFAAPASDSIPSGASVATATDTLLPGASLAGIEDGKMSGGNPASPVVSRFGDRGAPAFVYQKIPDYPALARRLGKEGRVLLKLLIDANGKLLNVEVVEAAGYGFTEAAVAAVQKSTYAPGIRDGVRVATWALLPISFRFL